MLPAAAASCHRRTCALRGAPYSGVVAPMSRDGDFRVFAALRDGAQPSVLAMLHIGRRLIYTAAEIALNPDASNVGPFGAASNLGGTHGLEHPFAR